MTSTLPCSECGADVTPGQHSATECQVNQVARPLRWTEADLDRCEHGRHSIDSCFDCPGGNSAGNLFLLEGREPVVRTEANQHARVRIGTTHRGDPIWVSARREPRSAG